MYNIFENLPKSVKHDARASWIGSLLVEPNTENLPEQSPLSFRLAQPSLYHLDRYALSFLLVDVITP